MKDTEYGEFILKVVNTLEKNGFPDKKVALPLEKMYETAHEKGLNFNKILDFLKEKDILHEKTLDKIIFYDKKYETLKEPKASMGLDGIKDFINSNKDILGNLEFGNLMNQAPDLLKNISPEQMETIKNLYANMSDDQRQNILKMAKDMGLL